MPVDRSDDELARTATAAGSVSGEPQPVAPLGSSLGRYRLERALGEGGMGVVHAAFDPDLERRVALKVLRAADGGGDEARQRLLREARAMARLTHPNVVTVHEVGSASGRDYVAMELVDGETLAEWLRDKQHSQRDIVAAFVAAGRGLAAAHAAGLVHRDFKPHNVLRRRDGRVCVTDFGLARGVEALEVTMRLDKKAAASENTPSALSGLTATGSVLGTPAYMAPEQWTGGTVGPAADQFAFSVALWEALTGERPFRGMTLDDLKAEVQRGPAQLDASKLPRRLRTVLRRALDPDPKLRWPSMDAMLSAIERRNRWPRRALFASATLVVVCAIGYVVLLGGGSSGSSCPAPAHALDDVWSARTADALAAAGRGELRDVLAKDASAWQSERERACSAPVEQRTARLACLDGALERFDLVHRALEQVTGDVPADAVLGLLVDPSVCKLVPTPRLAIEATPDTIAAFALAIESRRGDQRSSVKAEDAAAFASKPGLAACARAYALSAQFEIEEDESKGHAIANETLAAAEACGDDRLRAEVLLALAPLEAEVPSIGPAGRAAIAKAKAAVDRVAQPDLVASLDLQRANVLAGDGKTDEAIRLVESASKGYAARGRVRGELGAALEEINVRFRRATVDDMKTAQALCERSKAIARTHHFDHQLWAFEENEAYAMWFLGDQMGAHEELVRLYKPKASPHIPTRPLEGTIVDEAGKPIAGAIVAAGTFVFADSVGPLPFIPTQKDMRFGTSDLQGHFAIPEAPAQGGMIAQLGERRGFALIEPNVKLTLHATRHVSGKVALGTVPAPRVFVMVLPTTHEASALRLIAPVQPDGSFEMLAVPTGKLSIAVMKWGADVSNDMVFQSLPSEGEVKDLTLVGLERSGRSLDIVTRSTVQVALDGAQIFLVPGRKDYKHVGDVFRDQHGAKGGQMQMRFAKPIVGEAIPKAAIGKTRPGDLIAHFDGVPAGEITACAIGMSGDLRDAELQRKLNEHATELEVQCEIVGPDDQAIVVLAPPQKRFD